MATLSSLSLENLQQLQQLQQLLSGLNLTNVTQPGALGAPAAVAAAEEEGIPAMVLIGGKGGTGKTTSSVILATLAASQRPDLDVFIISTTEFEDASKRIDNLPRWDSREVGFQRLLEYAYEVVEKKRAADRDLRSFAVRGVFGMPNLYFIPKGVDAAHPLPMEVVAWYDDKTSNMKRALQVVRHITPANAFRIFDCDQLLRGTDMTLSMWIAIALSDYLVIPIEAESEPERIETVFLAMEGDLAPYGFRLPEFLGLLVTKTKAGASTCKPHPQVFYKDQLPTKGTLETIQKTVQAVGAKHGSDFKAWVTFDFDTATGSEVRSGAIRKGGSTKTGCALCHALNDILDTIL